MEIKIEHNPPQEELNQMGVFSWPIWEKDASEFPWAYDSVETCYILEGHVIVTPEGGKPVEIRPGDLVVFPNGMSCRWKVLKKVRKHYNFS
jgi:uncharacterized cupin superfamily protein